ncbi:hypothetical protein CYMTET_36845 [Cymbomonas tetramitiformis]|uniref:Uncharacterized protein n=1 Tax=Cymbomonas tetramitiformis TaxID=36881 RepID=A0AAE0CGJ5_9CHLO|nr:hypothetical protein CYMTET_36845 [Cymbomonas tetramitiformis]
MEGLRRLVKKDDRCFSFDLKYSSHCVGTDPDYQKFMAFDIQGALYQCSDLPFSGNNSPRVFVKCMKVLVECLRAPKATGERRFNSFKQRQHDDDRVYDDALLLEHLGLELDLKEGEFRVTSTRLKKIHAQATELLCEGNGVLPRATHVHITHLELEAVFKSVEAFLRELTGKVVLGGPHHLPGATLHTESLNGPGTATSEAT